MRHILFRATSAAILCCGCQSVAPHSPRDAVANVPSNQTAPAALPTTSMKPLSQVGPSTPPLVVLAAHQSATSARLADVPESLPAPPGNSPPQALSLVDFESVALASNPAVSEAIARVQSARGQFVQVGLLPNPTFGYLGSEIGNDGRGGQQGLYAGQEIVTSGKLRLARAVALREVQVAERVLAQAQLRVQTDVRMNFYEVLVAQRRVELTQGLATIGGQGVTATQSLLERKEVSQTELLQAKIEADSAAILVENAETARLGAWQRLTIVSGQPAMPLRRLAGDPTKLPPLITQEQAMGRIMGESPELAAAYARVERARWAIGRARALAVPNVDLLGSVQFDNATQDTIAGAQIGMPIPVFNRNQGGIQQARAELVAAQQAAVRTELDLRNRLATTYQRYAMASQQVRRYSQSIVPNVKEALDNTTQGYRAGEFNFLQQLNAQRTYFQTNLAYLESLEQFWDSNRELEGLLLSGSLAADLQ